MTQAIFKVGDVRKVLRTLPDNSVDLVLTSPPFLALRSYLPADHPDKALEMGSEPTPGEFIDALLDVVEECDRVLAPHGSIAIELGDTYSGSGGHGGDYEAGGMREGQPKFAGSAAQARFDGRDGNTHGTGSAARPARVGRPKPEWLTQDGTGRRQRGADEAAGILAPRSRPGPEGRDNVDGWPLDKSLCLIPELFRISLVYGFNPLTGRPTPRWRARNVIRWCRPNPPVGALGDKVRPATSDMVIACHARDRYFDLDAVRTPLTEPGAVKRHSTEQRNAKAGWGSNNAEIRQNEAGGPPLDWWKISTQPYPGSHYATWPEELCIIPIKAMVPLRVCQVCGEPSRRIVDAQRTLDGEAAELPPLSRTERLGAEADGVGHWRKGTSYTTLGWTDCGHDDFRNGVVLDPFAGSGTTLAVATGHGRDAIGIDLDARNAELALERVGPLLLTVEDEVAA